MYLFFSYSWLLSYLFWFILCVTYFFLLCFSELCGRGIRSPVLVEEVTILHSSAVSFGHETLTTTGWYPFDNLLGEETRFLATVREPLQYEVGEWNVEANVRHVFEDSEETLQHMKNQI